MSRVRFHPPVLLAAKRFPVSKHCAYNLLRDPILPVIQISALRWLSISQPAPWKLPTKEKLHMLRHGPIRNLCKVEMRDIGKRGQINCGNKQRLDSGPAWFHYTSIEANNVQTLVSVDMFLKSCNHGFIFGYINCSCLGFSASRSYLSCLDQ